MKGVKIFFSTLTLRTDTKTRGIRGFKIVKGNVVDATGSLTQIPSTSCCTHLPSSYACKALPYSEIPGKSPPSLQVACSQPTIDGCDGTQNSSPFASSWGNLVVQFPLQPSPGIRLKSHCHLCPQLCPASSPVLSCFVQTLTDLT